MKKKAMKRIGTICCMAFLLAGLMGWTGSAYGDDIEVRLPSTDGSDAFQVQDSTGKPRLHVQSNGRIGIGTTDPKRILHLVTNWWPVKFEFTGTGSHANLDFDSPWITPGNFSRLDWRSNIGSQSTQFAAIDVVFVDKNDQSAKADMVFRTMSNGDLKQHMIINNEGDVGIGFDAPTKRLHVKDSKNNVGIINFENTYDGQYADLLNLKINTYHPGNGNNFITFYDSGTIIGNIDGNGSGGVRYNTSGSDLAEYLPRLQADEVIDPGDIVGISAGKISKITENADYLRVVSTAPGWVGNCPGEEKEHLYEQVAFVGQVPIRVRGTVQTGDFIVPSGLNDGVGVAVSSEELTPALAVQVVGRAWEDSSEEAVKKINSAVGLHMAAQPLHALNMKMEREIGQLTRENRALEARLAALERRIGSTQ